MNPFGISIDSTPDISHTDQLTVIFREVSSFPNVNSAFRIYLSILGTSCEGKRSFFVLKRVKNYLRSTMGQAKLSALSLLSIESELLKNLDIDDIIIDFAHKKSRKVNIV